MEKDHKSYFRGELYLKFNKGMKMKRIFMFKKLYHKRSYQLLLASLVTSVSIGVIAGYATTIQTSRYTISEAGLNQYQEDLLHQTVTMTFPQSRVHTIDAAVKYLLRFSGYQLVPQEAQPKQVQAILRQSLPESLRTLRNVTIEQGLSGLVGQPFQILYDPVHRLISFRLRPGYQAVYLSQQQSNSTKAVIAKSNQVPVKPE